MCLSRSRDKQVIEDFNFKIKDGRLYFRGLSWGYGDCYPFVVEQGTRHIVVRVPSRTDWGSVGSSTSLPAEWHLWEIVKLGDDVYRIATVISFLTPGRAWRRAKQTLIAKMKELEET